jgi:alcohol dehydrogenase
MELINIKSPEKLVFGPRSIDQMAEDYIASGTKRIFLLSVPPVLDLIQPCLKKLNRAGIQVHVTTEIAAEPSFSEFETILGEARGYHPDSIAGIGGGSVMDMAKLIAVFIDHPGKLSDVVGINLINQRKTHLICAPTTSGTGSEVSPNSILLDDTNGGKKGIISPYLVPDVSYIDPELTLGLPPGITAYTGLDALTHCIEAYANKFAHPFIDTYAIKGISLIYKNLLQAVKNGNDIEARSHVSMGSLFGGFCLGPVNTGAVHALAYPLGSDFKIAHGLSNAILLPYVMEYNLEGAPDRYADIARAIGICENGTDQEIAKKGIEKIKTLIKDCDIPLNMREAGIQAGSLGGMAKSAVTIQRLLKNNVREVSYENALAIYEKAF